MAVPRRTLIVSLSVILFFWVLVLFITGGFVIESGDWRVSSRNARRPFIAYAILVALAMWRYGARTVASDLSVFRPAGAVIGDRGAIALALAVVVLGLVFGTYAASAADAYGYVSQAALWLKGDLHVAMPLTASLPWSNPEWSVSPLGYRPATIPGHIVPTYAPGLPLMMAAISWLHPNAVYWVVPILGGLLVWVSFRLGCRLAGAAAGFLTASLVATSPVFVHHLVVPMSDVPAAALWTASFVAAMVRTPRRWLAAGALASLATLVRPNTVVLVLAPLLWAGWNARAESPSRGRRVLEIVAFGAGLVPGVVIVALVNDWLYGSPLISGYGDLSQLYAWRYGWENLQRFPAWLVHSETFFIVLAIVGGAVLFREPEMRWHVAVAVTSIVIVSLVYLFYLPFDTWVFLRFLLPAIPLLLAFAAVGFLHLARQLPADVRVPVAMLVLGAVFVWRMDLARGAFDFRDSERRYVIAGQYVATHYPENAVFIAMQHSGSLRHYSGRMTVRWDAIDPSWLDRAPDILRRAGFDPYLLIEDEEESQIRERLGSTRLGKLNWQPVGQLHHRPDVRIYDPDDAPR